MSQAEIAVAEEARRTCERCSDGVVCFECFRAAHGRRRDRTLAGTTDAPRLEPTQSLTTRDIEHRRRMLNYLATGN